MQMDDDDFNASIRPTLVNEVDSCTPVGPYEGPTLKGRLVAADKWKDTILIKELNKTIRVILTEENGIVDFRLQDGSVVVYMSESTLVLNPDSRRNLVKLQNMKNVKGFVIAELNNFSEDYYFKMQHFAVLDLGLTVFPVANQTEAALLLSEMVSFQNGMSSDPFKTKKVRSPAFNVVLSAILTIPGLGEKKAKQLLEEFGSINKFSAFFLNEKDWSEASVLLSPPSVDCETIASYQSFLKKIGSVWKANWIFIFSLIGLKNISKATVDELVPIVGLHKANDVFKFFSLISL